MAKPCTKLRFHFILELQARCAATPLIISWPFPVSRMLRSWKARLSSAMSCLAVYRVAQLSLIGSSVTRRNAVNRRICTPSSRHSARPLAEDFRAVTAGKAKPDEWKITNAMIGEGTQSTNQRRHNYVQENVEVGFFTDPTVCIGCKACEVACKEWNEVPD